MAIVATVDFERTGYGEHATWSLNFNHVDEAIEYAEQCVDDGEADSATFRGCVYESDSGWDKRTEGRDLMSESPTPSPQLSDLEKPILRALEDVLSPWTFNGSEPAVVRLLAAIRAARDEKLAAHAALVEALRKFTSDGTFTLGRFTTRSGASQGIGHQMTDRLETADEIALKVIQLMETAKITMEMLRANCGDKGNGWNARALSIAMTELETAQLWVANARPE